MSWWGQVRHVLWKDLRLARVLLLAYVGAVVLFGAATLWTNSSEPAPWPLFPFVVVLVGAFALVTAVQADPVRGRDANWRTLPLNASAVAAAKVILAIGLTTVALLGLQLPWLGIHGLGPIEAAGPLAAAFGPGVKFFATMGAIALVTRNVRSFMVVAILLVVAMNVWSLFMMSREGRGELAASDPLVADGRIEGVSVSSFQPSRHGQELHLTVNLRIEDPPVDVGYALIGSELELLQPDGRTWTLPGDGGVRPFTAPPALAGDSVRWIGPAAPEWHIVAFNVPVDQEAWQAASSPGVRIALNAAVEVVRPTLLARVPMSGELTTTQARRFEVIGQRREDGEPVLRIRTSKAMSRTPQDPWPPDPATPGGLSYVLYHPGSREALNLDSSSSEGRGFGWILGTGGYVQRSTLQPIRDMRWWPFAEDDRAVTVDPGWLPRAELLVFEWISAGTRKVELEWDVADQQAVPPPAPDSTSGRSRIPQPHLRGIQPT